MPNFFINVKEKGAKKAAGNIGTLTGSMKKMVAQAAIAGVALETMRKAIVRSAEIEGVKRGFDNLANSTGFSAKAFDKFSKATDRTIDNLTLMKKANAAMLLGITDSEDQMANMFDVAQRLGQSLGIDTVQSIDSLVTGMGRQSKLMLDNLGIMVDTNKSYRDFAAANNIAVSAMTDTQRKQAFVNAAMKEANFLVEQLGAEQLTTKDKIAQMNTALLESLTAFGNLLTPLVIPLAKGLELIAVGASSVIEQFGNLGHEFTGTATSLRGFNVWLKANEEDEEALKNKTAELNAEQRKLKEELEGLTSTGSQAIDFTKDFALSIDLSGDSMVDYNKNMLISEQQYGDLMQSIVDGTFNLDEFKIMQEESTLATINDNTERAKAIQFLIDEAERKKLLIIATQEENVIVDESALALAEFTTLQQAKLDKYTLEQELIAALIEANPQLAASLNLVTDASKAVTKAKEAQGKAEIDLMKATASAFKEFAGGAKIAARIQQTAATIDAYRTINKIMADPKLVFPTNVLMATTVGATAFANVMSISKSIGEFKTAATGMNEVVTKPTMILAGEAGAESVNITPLSDNAGGAGGGGGSVTVNVSGNVLSQDFVEGELAENIKEAIRRGTDFGIS